MPVTGDAVTVRFALENGGPPIITYDATVGRVGGNTVELTHPQFNRAFPVKTTLLKPVSPNVWVADFDFKEQS